MTLRLRYLTLKLRPLCWVLRRLRAGRIPLLDAMQPANCVIFKKSRWPMEERLCRKEGLSMVLSLYLRSTLGIIFFQSLDKFGGAFEEPFLRLEDRTRPMRRLWGVSISDHCQHFGNGLGLAIPAR